MLQRRFRLNTRWLFKKALSQPRRYSTPYFSVFTVPQNSTSENGPLAPRFGFVISKKIHKRAVIRNKIRRRLQHILQQDILPTYDLTSYCALVILVKPAAVEAEYSQLQNAATQCFQKLRGQKTP